MPTAPGWRPAAAGMGVGQHHDVSSVALRCAVSGLLNTQWARTNGHTRGPTSRRPRWRCRVRRKQAGPPNPRNNSPAAAMTSPTGYDAPSSRPNRVTDRGSVPAAASRAGGEHPGVDHEERRHDQQHLNVEFQDACDEQRCRMAVATIAPTAAAVASRTDRVGGSQPRNASATGMNVRN